MPLMMKKLNKNLIITKQQQKYEKYPFQNKNILQQHNNKLEKLMSNMSSKYQKFSTGY